MNQEEPLSDDLTSLTLYTSNKEILAPDGEERSIVMASAEDVNKLGGSNAESGEEHGENWWEKVEQELNCGMELASDEENAEFHRDFPHLPDKERLIKCFGLWDDCPDCSSNLKPKIRLYISENHSCLAPSCDHSKSEIYRFLDMTLIFKLFGDGPRLLHKVRYIGYLFSFDGNSTSVLDVPFSIICKTWRVVQIAKSGSALKKHGNPLSKQTICACREDDQHYPKTLLDSLFLGLPEKILDLLFTSNFIKDTMNDRMEFEDINMSEWIPYSSHSQQALPTRRMSYIQDNVKYKVQDRIAHFDPNDYISVLSTKESQWEGYSFCLSTRTCIMWDSVVSSRVVVTTKFEWTEERPLTKYSQEAKAHYIKQQVDDYEELLDAISNHIEAHQPEFLSQDDMGHIATMINTHKSLLLETSPAALLNLDPSKIPSVLELLQNEVKNIDSDHQHSQKCIKLLQFLVNKHHILPPSLFLTGVSLKSRHILAVGGFSDIYKGTFEGKPVCIKALRTYIEDGEEKRNKDLREFYKETLLWNRLNHPNLLPFLGVTTTLFTGKVALVSPWMVNGPITNFLKLKPRHDRLKVLSEIIAGIIYLHSHNIVHGDIKGANVLVDEYGQCYLGDFGLAVTSFTTSLLNSTTSGIVKGTTRWMAPELFITSEDSELVGSIEQVCVEGSKRNTIKLARDIYAFACTIYEIIAGEPPFSQLTDVQVMFKVLGGERPPRPYSIDWCSDSIWSLVEQCWVQKSYLRPTASDVHKFLSHLEQLRWVGRAWGEEKFLPTQENISSGNMQAAQTPTPEPSHSEKRDNSSVLESRSITPLTQGATLKPSGSIQALKTVPPHIGLVQENKPSDDTQFETAELDIPGSFYPFFQRF